MAVLDLEKPRRTTLAKLLREAAGVSQNAVAAALGIDAARLSNIENGRVDDPDSWPYALRSAFEELYGLPIGVLLKPASSALSHLWECAA